MKRELQKQIVGTVLSFAVSVFTALAVLLFCSSAVLSRSFANGVMRGDRYVSAVSEELYDGLESYAIPGGLPEDFFEDIITEEDLLSDIDYAVRSSFSGEIPNFERTEDKLRAAVLKYAEENGIFKQASEENIEHMVSLCAAEHSRLVFSVLLKYTGLLGSRAFPWLPAVGAVFALLAFLLGRIVGKIGDGYLKNGLSGGATMLLIFPVFVLLTGTVSRLGLTRESMFCFATVLIYAWLALLIISALLILFFTNVKTKKKKSESR